MEMCQKIKATEPSKLSWGVNLLFQKYQNQMWNIITLDKKITNPDDAQLLLFE